MSEELIKKHTPAMIWYDGSGMLWGNDEKGSLHLANIRGWGHLTGKGHGAWGLTSEDAEKIYAYWAKRLVDGWNNQSDDVAALKEQLTLAISGCEDMRKAKDSTYDELQKALKRAHEAEADNAALSNALLTKHVISSEDGEYVGCAYCGASARGKGAGKRFKHNPDCLCELCGHPGAAILAERDALALRVEALLTQHDTMVETQQRNLAAMDKLVSEKDYQLAQLRAERDALKAEITELDTISYIRADRLADLRDAHQTALARIAVLEGERECRWVSAGEEPITTDCGHTFLFTEDGVKENGFKYCPFCRGSIVEFAPPQPTSHGEGVEKI